MIVDALRRLLPDRHRTPPPPPVEVYRERERAYIERRRQQIDAHLRLLQIEAEVPVMHRLIDRRKGGPNLTRHRRRRNDRTPPDTTNEGMVT